MFRLIGRLLLRNPITGIARLLRAPQAATRPLRC
jgi:hypothetical protein